MNKISVYGGLGNQMFQYALFLSFRSKGKETGLYLADFFYLYHHNGFDLYTAFDLQLNLRDQLTSLALTKATPLYRNKLAKALLRRVIPWARERKTIFREKKEFHFASDVFDVQADILLGTWQAEGYFNGINDLLYREFIFRKPTDKVNTALAEKIVNTNSVSIHIRRGDFQASAWKATHYVIRGTAYYQHALRYLQDKVSNPHYFIFSDDMNWVKENLVLPNCTYIEHNKGKHSYVDMYLMSICKHNIIANSTFSWWGAWLNQHTDKITIMPERWLNGIESPGIFPQQWIKMPVE